MKSHIFLVFVLAFIGLTEPALTNFRRLRGGGFASFPPRRIQESLEINRFRGRIQELFETWPCYQFFIKILNGLTNKSGRITHVRLS